MGRGKKKNARLQKEKEKEEPKEDVKDNEDIDRDEDSEDQEMSGDDTDVRDAEKTAVQNPFFSEGGGDDSGEEEDSDDSDEEDSDSDGDGEKAEKEDVDSSEVSDSDSDSDDDETDKDGKDEDSGEKGEAVTDEDFLLNMLKSAREKKVRDSPPDIKLKQTVTDITFHPEENILAVSNIQGELSIFSYSNEENKITRKCKVHRGGVRCVEYNLDGDKIISGGKDKLVKVLNLETGKTEYGGLAHPSPLYSVLPLTQGAVSGDEDGTVKIWDLRSGKCTLTSKRFDEFVSALYAQETKKRIIASSGEGTIQSWDLRMNKPDIQSEMYSSELTCLASVREETKLVVGDGEGTLYIFNEGQYGYHSDQYAGHPDAINCMIPVTDNVLITGCEDGILRAVHLFPHRFVGQVGHHEGNMPIERLDVNGSGDLIASSGHDNKVKFWNIAYLENMDYKKKRKPILKVPGQKRKKMSEAVDKEKEYQLPSSGRTNRREFFKGFE